MYTIIIFRGILIRARLDVPIDKYVIIILTNFNYQI